MDKIIFKKECLICKRNKEEFKVRGTNEKTVKDLFDLHLEKIHNLKSKLRKLSDD